MDELNKLLRTIFDRAVEMTDARQRADYITSSCKGDEGLRRKVEALLAAEAQAGYLPGGMEGPVPTTSSHTAGKPGAATKPSSVKSRRLGDYELGQALGRGGMGVVYEATQVSLHRSVALKMITECHVESATCRRRFSIEAETAAKLDHPNIVPIYEVGEWEGEPFISMKLIPGENLRKKIASGDLCLAPKEKGSTRQANQERAMAIVSLVATTARAVHHAHQNGVIHRDLKPGNIIVDHEGHPHLTDFGLAKMVEKENTQTPGVPLTVSGLAFGTPGYMSPEQAAGQRVSAASDTYSLGAILYEMLSGQPPIVGATLVDTLRLTVEQEAKRPSTRNPRIDRDLDTICIKCLEKNPGARYATAEALAEDLERWLRREPIQARPAHIGLRIQRWVRRNRAVAALILALGLGLGWSLILLHMVSQQKAATAKALAESEQRRSGLLAQIYKRLNELEHHNDRGYPEVVTSEERAAMTDRIVSDTSSAGVVEYRYTFGIYSRQSPSNMIQQFAPILTYLESTLSSNGVSNVRFDLEIYGTYQEGIQAIISKKIDFMRLGPASYVIARNQNPRLELVAVQNYKSPFRGAIFTREDTGITNLAGLMGSGRFAFGDPESTSGNFLSKKTLLDEGVTASSLIECCTNLKSHSTVLNAVVDGVFIAGAGNATAIEQRDRDLRQKGKAGLRILKKFKEPGTPWVARQGMDPGVVASFRACLLSLTNKNILDAFQDEVTGFMKGSPHDYDSLEEDMSAAKIFESR